MHTKTTATMKRNLTERHMSTDVGSVIQSYQTENQFKFDQQTREESHRSTLDHINLNSNNLNGFKYHKFKICSMLSSSIDFPNGFSYQKPKKLFESRHGNGHSCIIIKSVHNIINVFLFPEFGFPTCSKLCIERGIISVYL